MSRLFWKAGVPVIVERGSCSENGYIESFNGKLRNELLNREIFTTPTEAKILIEEWQKEYNQVRPHSALNYQPPGLEAIILTCSPKVGPDKMLVLWYKYTGPTTGGLV